MKNSLIFNSGAILMAAASVNDAAASPGSAGPGHLPAQQAGRQAKISQGGGEAVAVSVQKGQHLKAGDPRLSARAANLIRIGEEAIAKENDSALDAYFARDFAFHGPGADLNYEQLKAVFAAYRASFRNFRVRREAIMENGAFVAARTTMSGTFTGEFTTPIGPVAPTGRYVEWELNNIFRYDDDGRLVEEWVQYDTVGFIRALGVELKIGASGN